MDLVARFHALQRTELRAGDAWVAHLVAAHRIDKCLLEGDAQRLHDDEALARDAALAGVDHARRRANLRRRRDVGVLEHQIGIRAAELEHALLELCAGDRGDAASGRHAAGEGHGCDVRVFDQRLDLCTPDQNGAEQSVRKAGVP